MGVVRSSTAVPNVPEILSFIARRLKSNPSKIGLHKKNMVCAADTLGRHKNPGSDTVGVVGVTVRAIGALTATCKLRVPLPDSCADKRRCRRGCKLNALEIQLHAKLQLSSRTDRTRDAIEIGVCNLSVRNTPSWAVEEIESLEAELSSDSFSNGELFEQ
jgi:hypothetical protein